MKANLLFQFLILAQILSAQNFTEVGSYSELDGVSESSIAFADVDGDNDQDLLITGKSGPIDQISKLYIN